MKTIAVLIALAGSVSLGSACLAEQNGRPENMPLAEFQFGPYNRWTFSHMREVLPTVNIERDAARFLPLIVGVRVKTSPAWEVLTLTPFVGYVSRR